MRKLSLLGTGLSHLLCRSFLQSRTWGNGGKCEKKPDKLMLVISATDARCANRLDQSGNAGQAVARVECTLTFHSREGGRA